ncbi:MAG: WbqC family protein, partial [Tannerella sp.]|nr:WbqC family protein [Tannerella sp.]
MAAVYLSSAYLAPVQYYTKLLPYETVFLETAENYLKQTYRNRCLIAGANGVQALTVPVEKPPTEKCLMRDVRISDHGHWRHLHWQALTSAYGLSPFFEYCQDDFAPLYARKFDFLFDFNEALRQRVCELADLHPDVRFTPAYEPSVPNDFRESIRPKHPGTDKTFLPKPYPQVFGEKHGFLPNLSIVDLLFNMGPETVTVLQQSREEMEN